LLHVIYINIFYFYSNDNDFLGSFFTTINITRDYSEWFRFCHCS